MKNKIKTSILGLLVAVVGLSFWNPMLVVKASQVIKSIEAQTYVADQGQMVDRFVIEFDDKTGLESMIAADLDIINNYDGYPLDPTGAPILTSYEDDGIVLTWEGNVLTIDVADFKYNASLVGLFEFKSETYPVMNFSATAVTKVVTKTVDDFLIESFTASNGVTIPYRLYLSEKQNQPLVIWMHGAGEVGTDNVKPLVANRGGVAFVENGYDTNVIAAQYPVKFSVELTDEELAQMNDFFLAYEELLTQLIDTHKMDKDRVYLTGASMGGGLALKFLTYNPELFAATVVISSRGTIKDLADLATLEDYPIWLFHGEEDVVNVSTISKGIYEELVRLGNNKAKLTIYDTETLNKLKLYGPLLHWAWVPALNDPEMHAWLFEQDKNPFNTKLYMGLGVLAALLGSFLLLGRKK